MYFANIDSFLVPVIYMCTVPVYQRTTFVKCLFFSHQQLRHENLVNLIEVFRRKKRLFLVFEFVDHTVLDDLERYPNGLDELTVKKAMWQVLKAVEFCHSHNVRFRKVLLSRHFFLLIFIISYRVPVIPEKKMPLSRNHLGYQRAVLSVLYDVVS